MAALSSAAGPAKHYHSPTIPDCLWGPRSTEEVQTVAHLEGTHLVYASVSVLDWLLAYPN